MLHSYRHLTMEQTIARLERDDIICQSTAEALRRLLTERLEPTRGAGRTEYYPSTSKCLAASGRP